LTHQCQKAWFNDEGSYTDPPSASSRLENKDVKYGFIDLPHQRSLESISLVPMRCLINKRFVTITQ